jgi:hypothetical protein
MAETHGGRAALDGHDPEVAPLAREGPTLLSGNPPAPRFAKTSPALVHSPCILKSSWRRDFNKATFVPRLDPGRLSKTAE